MTSPAVHDPHHPESHSPAFTQEEINGFHSQDVAAAKAVVVLMVSIFLIGVVIYTIVNITCMV